MERIDNDGSRNAEFEFISQKIRDAKYPEDVFGSMDGTSKDIKAGRSVYYLLCKKVHPDPYKDTPYESLANSTFLKLHKLWELAESKLKTGTYGNIHSTPVEEKPVIKLRKKEAEVLNQVYSGEISNTYDCLIKEGSSETPGYVKIARDPLDNDLIETEARLLKHLKRSVKFDEFKKYYPELIESFNIVDAHDLAVRQGNLFTSCEELYTLKEVKEQYPAGINPKDMAWMWRRLLVGMGFAHRNEVINGAMLPQFIFIQPQKHGVVLGEWSYGVLNPKTTGESIKAVNSELENWYPEEVFRKDLPTPGLDILMGARNMVYLMGGDPLTGNLPDTTPKRLSLFFKGCLLPKTYQRPQDAWGLLKEFDELISDIWGERHFRPFTMPKRANSSFG